jgi:hypothetical protein
MGTRSTSTCTEARSPSKAEIQVEHQFDEGGHEGSWLGPRSLHLDALSLKTLGLEQADDQEAPALRTCRGKRWSTPMEHLRKGGRPRRGQGGRRDYQEREAVPRKTREDRMTTELSANVAGLRGESATLPMIGELPEQFLAAGGRG